MPIFLLTDETDFPPVELAEPDGLLAIGGDLSVPRLLAAYRSGIFPWYSEGGPILWWAPDPRFVLFPERMKIPHGLRRVLKKNPFTVTFDTAFEKVIQACRSVPRPNQSETWITPDMLEAYTQLHREGHAHSVEAWRDGRLVGGLYGVSLGGVFFGESMFSFVSNASKVALAALIEQLRMWQFDIVDCQIHSPLLESFGGEYVPRKQFMSILSVSVARSTPSGNWSALRSPTVPAVPF